MATFKHDRTECRCVDNEVNRRIFWLDLDAAGRVYVYLSANDVTGAAGQFSRHGVLEAGELPGPGDSRIYAVEFESDLTVMLEKMLEAGFTDPTKEIAAWLLVLVPACRDLARRDRFMRSDSAAACSAPTSAYDSRNFRSTSLTDIPSVNALKRAFFRVASSTDIVRLDIGPLLH